MPRSRVGCSCDMGECTVVFVLVLYDVRPRVSHMKSGAGHSFLGITQQLEVQLLLLLFFLLRLIVNGEGRLLVVVHLSRIAARRTRHWTMLELLVV